MKALLIQTLTVEQLKNIVNDVVITQLKNHFKKEEKEIQYISRKEAAKLLNCSLNTLDEWTVKKYLTAYRFGITVRYLKHEVEEAGPNIIRKRKVGGGHV